MLSMLFFVAAGLSLVAVEAQTTYSPSIRTCDRDGSTLSACNYAATQINDCHTLAGTTGTAYASCFCNQALFNAFYNCENEQRQCIGNNKEDGYVQSVIDTWNSYCDTRIAFTPTTPVLTSVNRDPFCTAAALACGSAVAFRSQCTLSFTQPSSQLTACICAPRVLSYDYTCLYIGNTSCSASPATLTNLPGYKACDNAASVYASINSTGSLPASTVGSTTTLLSSNSASMSSSSITRPALPGSSSSGTVPQSTSSSTSPASLLRVPWMKLKAVTGLVILWWTIASVV